MPGSASCGVPLLRAKITLLSLTVLAVLCLVAVPAPASAQSQSTVLALEARGVVDPIMAQYLARGLSVADSRGAELVLVRMDTPGGLDTSMRTIVQAILNSPVPVVVYVEPQGARAASAGMFIAMAAHVAAMAPGTNIGAAHPVSLTEGEVPSATEDKVVNDAVAYIRSIAEQRGRNADWAEAAVRQSSSLPASEAVQQGVVDLVAEDVPALLQALHGRTVTASGVPVVLDLEQAAVEDYPMTSLETVAHGLVDPNIAYILLSLGTIALVAEFYNPGAIFPGVTGAICLILAFVALGSLPVNWGGIALIALAVVLFVLDLQVAGFALSVGGAVSFVLGSLLLFSPFTPEAPAMPQVRVSPWLLTLMTAVMVSFFGLALGAAVRAQRRPALQGDQVLLGQTGVAETDLAPEGVVRVMSESFTATADGPPVPAGEKVEVVAVDGLRLRVRRADEPKGGNHG